eukprot:525350_1
MQTSLLLLDELIVKANAELCRYKLQTGNKIVVRSLLKKMKHSIESKKNSKYIETLSKSGILKLLVTILVNSVDEIIANRIITIMRCVGSKQYVGTAGEYIEAMINQLLHLKSEANTPKYGIFAALYGLSWTMFSRHKIVNGDTLNYLLSNTTITSLYNDNGMLLKMARIKCMLLFAVIHLQFSVKGNYVASRSIDIVTILNAFLKFNDQTILHKTCQIFSKIDAEIIPPNSMGKIVNLLTLNNKDLTRASVSCLNQFVALKYESGNVDLFMKFNVLKKLSNLLVRTGKNKGVIIHICILIEKFMRFSNSEYVVDCIIKYNIVKLLLKIIDMGPA